VVIPNIDWQTTRLLFVIVCYRIVVHIDFFTLQKHKVRKYNYFPSPLFFLIHLISIVLKSGTPISEYASLIE